MKKVVVLMALALALVALPGCFDTEVNTTGSGGATDNSSATTPVPAEE